MNTLVVGTLAVFLAWRPNAQADLLRATRPGIMCESPDALAKLSLPDGSSRTAAPAVSPAVQAIARAGNCIDFKTGNVVILVTRHHNTSVVQSYTFAGDDGAHTFTIPNIDYAPYSPPPDEFADAIKARCPAKYEDTVVFGPSTYDFVQSLPAALRKPIEQAVEDECSEFITCRIPQRAVQVSKHHLVQRWAEFTCSH